ncbi:MAG: prepilin-type N-terminal cleavage/methylation domain-containing protein [Peptoniphilus sp.]|nr:prepilin-type N-terminal cleavage/methylation domain-containing protein [Peptoniphilus sp.]
MKKITRLKSKRYCTAKGFTLIELVVSIALAAVVFSALASVLGFSLSLFGKVSAHDGLFQEAYFTENFLYEEIASADYIVPNGNPRSLGFTLIKVTGAEQGQKITYRYTYYSLEDKTLKRHSINTEKKLQAEYIGQKMGVNNIITGVEGITCDLEDEKITLDILYDRKGAKHSSKIIVANRTFEEYH